MILGSYRDTLGFSSEEMLMDCNMIRSGKNICTQLIWKECKLDDSDI